MPADRQRRLRSTEGLMPLFNGTLDICSHRKVISITNAYERCCSHFDKLEAMNLSLKT